MGEGLTPRLAFTGREFQKVLTDSQWRLMPVGKPSCAAVLVCDAFVMLKAVLIVDYSLCDM